MINDVDVAIAWELDAQILDLKHWSFGAHWLKAVGALEFCLTQLRQRIDERVMLLCVCSDWIGEQAVFLAVSCHIRCGLLDWSA